VGSLVRTPGPGIPESDPKVARLIRLSQVVVPQLNTKDPFIIIQWDRKTSGATVKGAELIAGVGEAQNEGRRPTHLLLSESKKVPEDLIGIPTCHPSADALPIKWLKQGQEPAIKADKLLAFRHTKIPRGTRMFISIYEDDDADFGKVIGIRINSAAFVPIDYLTEEEKEERARKKAEKEQAKQQAKAKRMEQEQAVAELPADDADQGESEAE
jgi:hypothetical protein